MFCKCQFWVEGKAENLRERVCRRLLLICRFSVLEYSAGSGVKSVHCVLVVFIKLFSVDQVAIKLRYGSRFSSAIL